MAINYLSEQQNKVLNDVIDECNKQINPKHYFLQKFTITWHNNSLIERFQGYIWEKLNEKNISST